MFDKIMSKSECVKNVSLIARFVHSSMKRSRDLYIPIIGDAKLGSLINDTLENVDNVIRHLESRING